MASTTFFHKPELALRRALELESIHQDDAALNLLHEVLSSRRSRTTWSPAFEQIMIAYLDLCLKMHKSREAKDGLHQYRNLAATQAPGSLEQVIRYLMDKAEQKCNEAKAFVDAETTTAATASTSAAATAGGGADEDEEGFGASPQAILLSTMSTDPAKSQRDSTVLLPALKFLWETYRTVLDILRSNSKLEHVYHMAAVGALNFCRVYKRRMEFRHLSDMLRMHLGNLRQYGSLSDTATGADESKSNKVRGWEGWTTESIELHLQTRFTQLETASVLHRYTEGFRTVEDIYNILQISHARRKVDPEAPPPKAKLMAAYYEKLTTLFWVSENHLFHAFAWYKYYSLCKEYNRSMSEDMKRMQASAVLLATLCIPQLPNQAGSLENKQHGITTTMEDDHVKQKMARMATLLGFHTRNPTREALLTEIRSKNILDQVPQYLRDLYVLLEETVDPLVMVEQARPLLNQLKLEIGATTSTDRDNEDVEDTTLGRYVKPLTSVLLLKLIVNMSAAYHTVSIDHLKKLTSGLDMTFEQIEKSIVQFSQSKTLSVRLDHRAGCLRFGSAQLESDMMRSQLTVLSKHLEQLSRVIQPRDITNQLAARSQLYKEVRQSASMEHAAVLERKDLIEKRKEEAERLAQEKVREETRLKVEEEKARKAEEEKRIAREQRLREVEKQRKIQQELENQEKKRFLLAMGKKTEDITEEEMANIDTEALQREHQEKVNKKKEEAERKTKEAARRLDYLVRAIRIEELPLIKEKYDERTELDRERYEQETIEKAQKATIQWEADVKDKKILEEHSVFAYFQEFEKAAMAGRQKKYDELCAEADRKAEFEAEKGKIRRARKRKDEESKRLAEEEERKKEEEQKKIEEEEKQRREEARREKEAKEEELRQAELKRMEDERRKKESEQQAKAPTRYVPPSLRGSAGGGGGGGAAPDERRGRFGDAGGYPGGGRYEGRDRPGDSRPDDRRSGGAGGNWRERGGGDDRRGGSTAPSDDRRGGFEEHRGGGAAPSDDRRGDGGGFGDDRRGGFDGRRGAGGFGDDRRGAGGGFGDDRRGGNDRNEDDRRGGGGGGSSRFGSDRRAGGNERDDVRREGDRGPRQENTRWR